MLDAIDSLPLSLYHHSEDPPWSCL